MPILTWVLMMFAPMLLFSGNVCNQSEPSPSILRIVAQGCAPDNHERSQTGFLVTDAPDILTPSIVTALHGVANCSTIDAFSNSEVITQLKIVKIDFLHDVALLSIPIAQQKLLPSLGLTVTDTIPQPDKNGKVEAICTTGYPAGIKDQWTYNLLNLQTRVQGPLYKLLPANTELINAFDQRQSPNRFIKVLRVDGELAHGVSGAPLINESGQVIGIIEGGLKDVGADTVSWAIPWADIEWEEPNDTLLGRLEQFDPRILFSVDSSVTATPTPEPTRVPPTATSTPIPTVCPFWIQIVDSSLTPIRGAQVKVIYGLEPFEDLTNSDGEVRGEIACDQQRPVVTIEVVAEGFESVEKDVTLATSRMKIKLSTTPALVLALTPSSTPAFMDSATSPIPQSEQIKFGQLVFCYENEFQQKNKQCISSRNEFSGVIRILYVSWTPSLEKKGALFKRIWYLDGIVFLTSENHNEYAYLSVDKRNSLKLGNYTVQLYVDGVMVQQGSFTIR